ncbi:hemolysin family protein [Hoyosella altamirensis]|uniref:CBS domain containing-hemolysin-like protein n=1 Tax=Hoyosella altamirensis TaxID=616997 RepID=A0A839RUN8_9ACTN|nr:hemolysin family protein [Hoyosella altamirensis]MBB3040059.1 CBS domain containing-hemolysin-like protein [Hoyosella altamirensis]
MVTEWLLVLLVIVLISANALFVAAEFALVTVDRPTVRDAAAGGDKRARSVQKALQTLSTQLSGAQLGITATSLLVGFVAEPSIAALLRGPIAWSGVPEQASLGVALGAAFIIATVTQMVFGELVPKNWAISEPWRVSRAVAGAQRGFTAAAKPLIMVLNGISNRIVRALGIEPREELASARSAQELGALAVRSAQQGLLDQAIARRVEEASAFARRTAADVMTPRPRVSFIDTTTPVRDILALVTASGHARFPVQRRSVDDIAGVVHFKSALAVPPQQRSRVTAADIMTGVRAVPASMGLGGVLEELRSGLQLAVVIDEYGGTAGIVTLEDLVEEVLGEIDDEQDRPSGRPRRLTDGSWSLPGLIRPDEAADITGIELPEAEHSDTLGGLITEQIARFAQPGDTVDLSAADLTERDSDGMPTPITARLRVTQTDGRRIARVRLSRIHTAATHPTTHSPRTENQHG